MAKLPCRKKCPENMQRQCRLEFGYAGVPPCSKLVSKGFNSLQQLKRLKTEIAAVLSDVEDSIASKVTINGRHFAERLRQLLARKDK